jgi:nicotinic acid phosphoribosyltransferase
MKKYQKQDQRLLAIWAIDCAERVLPLFENLYPADDRPRQAIAVGRAWIETGLFTMAAIRGASLAAHAAARDAKEHAAACFAARAAGQAVATAHVAQHAFGGAYYALKAIAAADPVQAEAHVVQEHAWQVAHAPTKLQQEVLQRVVIQKRGKKLFITVQKDEDF